MKNLILVFAAAIMIASCTKQASNQLATEAEKPVKEKMTVAELKVRTGIDLIKAWEESTLPNGFVARVNKEKKPAPSDAVVLAWASMSLTSTNNGDGTVTHTWVLPPDPNWSAMQHTDLLTADGSMDFSTVFSFANYYQYSWFLAGLPYITSATYPDIGGYYRVWATDLSNNVFVSVPTNP